jgi:hypothetical protein
MIAPQRVEYRMVLARYRYTNKTAWHQERLPVLACLVTMNNNTSYPSFAVNYLILLSSNGC